MTREEEGTQRVVWLHDSSSLEFCFSVFGSAYVSLGKNVNGTSDAILYLKCVLEVDAWLCFNSPISC